MTVPRARIDKVLELQRRQVWVESSTTYQEIGVRSFGRGLFLKTPIVGADLGAKRVFQVLERDLVISNVFAWEGAVAVAGPEHDQRLGSHRFMTWTPKHGGVDVSYLQHYFGSDAGLAQLKRASPGSAGRNRTLSISNFKAIEVPLPAIDEQRRVAAHLDTVADRTALAAAASTLDEKSSTAMLPRATADLLRAQALPSVQLRDLCSSINRTIHPGDDRAGATEFVGLEHVASHTGQSHGGRALADEKGRKLQFRSGELTYGYLRPYLNKAWAADRTGLCSVEQYVLVPHDGVNSALLGYVLRSALVLEAAVLATHSLQLPRLRVERLMSFDVPDIRAVADASTLLGELDRLRLRIQGLAGLSQKRSQLLDGLLPAARNEIFSAMR